MKDNIENISNSNFDEIDLKSSKQYFDNNKFALQERLAKYECLISCKNNTNIIAKDLQTAVQENKESLKKLKLQRSEQEKTIKEKSIALFEKKQTEKQNEEKIEKLKQENKELLYQFKELEELKKKLNDDYDSFLKLEKYKKSILKENRKHQELAEAIKNKNYEEIMLDNKIKSGIIEELIKECNKDSDERANSDLYFYYSQKRKLLQKILKCKIEKPILTLNGFKFCVSTNNILFWIFIENNKFTRVEFINECNVKEIQKIIDLSLDLNDPKLLISYMRL